MSTLFVSDLHLDPSRPAAIEAFVALVRGPAQAADGVYLLGDVFEAWLGDDDDAPLAGRIAAELRMLADAGVPVAFMRGNRDFLLGQAYADRCGMRLLPDACVVDLYGEPTLLLHGDTLCTDDIGYQAFRRQVRDPQWQAGFLAQPLGARRAFAAAARAASAKHQADISETISDVSPTTVEATFRQYGLRRMIHGHTHRAATHPLSVDGRECERIVLADWYDNGEVLEVRPDRSASRRAL
jgi:UDP-2,3-diacylglucosamine hydrolase